MGWWVSSGLGLVFSGIMVAVILVQTNNAYLDASSVSDQPHWALVGGLTDTTAEFRIRDNGVTPQRLQISENTNFDPVDFTRDIVPNEFRDGADAAVQAVTVSDLSAETRYYYRVTTSAVDPVSVLWEGTFRTPAPPGQAFDFSMVASGCAFTGSHLAPGSDKANIYKEMAKEQADLFLHLGDLHYEDINQADLPKRIRAIDRVLQTNQRHAFAQNGGLVYIWDDHDFLDNDGGRDDGEPGAREVALESYQLAFPHHPLAVSGRQVPVYHAFTHGSVRIIVSDLRSEATDSSIYSLTQRDWLRNELSQSSQYDLVIWMTSRPWIGDADPGSDGWYGFEQDRKELSDFMSRLETRNVIAVASDAHMVALDDGRNTYYGDSSPTAQFSFPILQTGPMDRLGSDKGGPYTDKCHAVRFDRNSQYSVLNFVANKTMADGSTQSCLEIRAFRIEYTSGDKTEILSKEFCGTDFFQPAFRDVKVGECSIPTFELRDYILGGLGVGMWFFWTVAACFIVGPFASSISSFSWAVWYILQLMIGRGIIFFMDIAQFDTMPISVISFCYMGTVFVLLSVYLFFESRSNRELKRRKAEEDATNTIRAVREEPQPQYIQEEVEEYDDEDTKDLRYYDDEDTRDYRS